MKHRSKKIVLNIIAVMMLLSGSPGIFSHAQDMNSEYELNGK